MNTLQNYYGIAIRQNKGQLHKMKKICCSFNVSLFGSKTEDERHKFCPQLPHSWCKYQADKLTVQKTYKERISIPEAAVSEIIKPIFGAGDLGSDELLRKCLHGETQNVNESLNNIIWTKCSKRVYVGRSTLEMCVASAVLSYNDGGQGLLPVYGKVGIEPGYFATIGLKKLDKKCILEMNRKSSEVTKRGRKRLRAQRKGFINKNIEEEGETYASGCF